MRRSDKTKFFKYMLKLKHKLLIGIMVFISIVLLIGIIYPMDTKTQIIPAMTYEEIMNEHMH